MENRETNQVAIITGGGSGIGLAIAEIFVSKGIKTVIVGRTEEKLQQACFQLGELSGYEVCDITILDAVPQLIETIVSRYGHIDILVNNAGIHIKKHMTEMSDEEFQRVVLCNQTAVFTMAREVSKKMILANRGVILNISSMASQYGIPLVMGYTAAKSAVEGMTRAMAVELSPLGIRVNCLAPGFIQTAMSKKAMDADPERKNKVMSRTPMRRFGTTTEVAKAAYYLCSDEASYITGVVLPVDGGNSIGF